MNPISFLLLRRRHARRVANLEYIEREQAAQDALAIRAVLCSIGVDVDDAGLVDHLTVLVRELHDTRDRLARRETQQARQESAHLAERHKLFAQLTQKEGDVQAAIEQRDTAYRYHEETARELAEARMALNGAVATFDDLRELMGLSSDSDVAAIKAAVHERQRASMDAGVFG